MRLLIAILFFSVAAQLYGQEFENASYINGRINNTQKIEFENGNFATLLRVSFDSLNINNEAYFDTTGCFQCFYYVLIKYDKNNNVLESIKLSSKRIDGKSSSGLSDVKLKYINNKVFIIGSVQKVLLINDSLIVEVPNNSVGGYEGIILQFDTDLNYERHFTASGGSIVKDIVYYNEEYILTGYYEDIIFKFQDFVLIQLYNDVPDRDVPECFVLAIDADTGKPKRGKTFGGPGWSDTEEIFVDAYGDFYISGRSGEYIFKYDEEEIKTFESFVDPTLYVMKISNQFDFIHFVDFNRIYAKAVNIVFDDKTNDLYVSFYNTNYGGLEINSEIIVPFESGRANSYIVKLKDGRLQWHTKFSSIEEGNKNFNGKLNSFYLLDGKIIIGSYFSTLFKVNDKVIPKIIEESSLLGIVMQLNADDGELGAYQFIAPPSHIELETFFIKPNGNYTFLADLYLSSWHSQQYIHPEFQKAFDFGADYMLVDMVPDLISNTEEPITNESNAIAISPNPSIGEFKITIHDDVNQQAFRYKMYNSYGQLIKSENLYDLETRINCSEYQSGTYFLQIINENQIIKTEKIIILK